MTKCQCFLMLGDSERIPRPAEAGLRRASIVKAIKAVLVRSKFVRKERERIAQEKGYRLNES